MIIRTLLRFRFTIFELRVAMCGKLLAECKRSCNLRSTANVFDVVVWGCLLPRPKPRISSNRALDAPLEVFETERSFARIYWYEARRQEGENMNMNDLSPELQEKARACRTPEELFKLAEEEGMEIPDEQLDAISGGWCSEHEWGCPADKCGVYGIGR